MTGHLPVLLHTYAADRSTELRAEADVARCLLEARRSSGAPRGFAAVRRALGAAMVRTGERVRGCVPADAALRVAR